jgi:DNA-binding transcriptional ArsR family regulator
VSVPLSKLVSDGERLDRVFGALADGTRRQILARLKESDASVTDLVALFAMSQPAVSKHLKVLEAAGLITRARSGQFRPCHLEAEPLAPAAAWLSDYRSFFERSFDTLAALLAELKAGEDAEENEQDEP